MGLFGILSGHMRLHFQQKNFPYGVNRSELGPPQPWAARSFVLGRIWGLSWVSRSLQREFEHSFGLHNSGKLNICSKIKKIVGKNWKGLDFFKIPAISTIVGRTSTPLLLYHISLQKSIGKMHKKNRLTAISRFLRFHVQQHNLTCLLK